MLAIAGGLIVIVAVLEAIHAYRRHVALTRFADALEITLARRRRITRAHAGRGR